MSLATNRPPDIWMELQFYPYPSGDTIIKRIARKPMAYPTFINGCLNYRNGWSDFRRAISDWKGNPQAAVISALGNDESAEFREIVEMLRSSLYRKVETSLFLLSSELRKTDPSPTPLWIHRGFAARAIEPLPRRGFRVHTVDATGSTWFRANPAQTVQTRFVTRAFMESAGIYETPSNQLNKPFPIIIGEHSNFGRTDANGQPLGYGTIPAKEWGVQIFSESQEVVTPGTRTVTRVPPPTLSAEKVYADGDGDVLTTYTYFVSANFIDGTQTTWSNAVTLTESRESNSNFSGLNVTNYNALTFTAPAGWEDYYLTNISWFRVMRANGTATAPTSYLDAESTWDGTTGTYNDGEIHGRNEWDVPKLPIAPEVGTAEVVLEEEGEPGTITTDTQWVLFGWAFGYCGMLDIFGADLRDDAVSRSVQLSPDDPDLMTPLSANWPHPNPWIDMGGIRVSAFYAKGKLVEKHRNGGPQLTLNSCGLTDTGDNLGEEITEANEAYKLLMNMFVYAAQVSVDGLGWNGITAPTNITFSDGTTMLDTQTIDEFQEISIPLCHNAGADHSRGFQAHWYVDEPVTVGQMEIWFNNTFCCHTGDEDDGQRSVFIVNPLFFAPGTPHYRQKIEIGGAPLPACREAEDEIETHIRYRFEYTPTLQRYEGDPQELINQSAADRYGRHDASGEDGLSLRFTRDKSTALAAMTLRLLLNSTIPSYQAVPISLQGVHPKPGSIFRVTHDDGIGPAGYINRPFFLIEKAFKNLNNHPDNPNMEIEIVGRDLQHVVDADFMDLLDYAFPLLTDETTMTPAASVWSNSTQYFFGDFVTHDGSTWIADGTPLIGAEPGVSSIWVEVKNDDEDMFILGDETSSEPPPVGAYLLR